MLYAKRIGFKLLSIVNTILISSHAFRSSILSADTVKHLCGCGARNQHNHAFPAESNPPQQQQPDGQHQVFQYTWLHDPFRPKIRLHPFIERLQTGIHSLLHGLIGIHSLYRFGTSSLRHRFGRQFRLLAVDIIRNLRRKNHFHTLSGSLLDSPVRPYLSHDNNIFTNHLGVAVKPLPLPEHQATLLLFRLSCHMRLQLLIKMKLQISEVGRPQLIQQSLACLVLLPFMCRTFIATQMQIRERKQIYQLINHILGKLQRLG